MNSNSTIDIQAIAAKVPSTVFQLSAIESNYQLDYISNCDFGSTFEALIDWIDPRDVDRFRWSLRKAIDQAINWTFEGRIRSEEKWIQISAALTEIHQTKAIFCGMIVDITKHKQIELMLRKSRKKLIASLSNQVTKLQQNQDLLKNIIDHTNASIFVKEYRNANGSYILLNREFAQRFNFDRERDIGKTDYDLFDAETAKAFQAADRAALAAGVPIQIEELEPRGGEIRTSIVVKFPLFDELGAFGIGGIATDITDLKRAKQVLEQANEELEHRVTDRTAELMQRNQELEATLLRLNQTQTQLIQSEKMSGLGQLVAGIAHEINNPVNFIYGNLNHASTYTQALIELIRLYQKHYPVPVAEIQHTIDEIDFTFLINDIDNVFASMQTGTTRIQSIVQSLRSFSRLDEADLKTVDLHEGIEQTLTLLQHRLKSQKITVIKHYDTIAPIQCYAGQLNQVWMNLLSNAIDALEAVEQRAIEIHTQQQSDLITIRIRDTGDGIAPDVRSRIFDPFFTTKPVGKGTGMGLAIAYQTIVEQHQGSIDCYEASPHGTEFVIKLPTFS